MSRPVRLYLKSKAMLLAIILDEQWNENNHVVEDAYMDFVNAKEEL